MKRAIFWLILHVSATVLVCAQDPTPAPPAAADSTGVNNDPILVFTTKMYLQAIEGDTLKKYFFEQKVKNAVAATMMFPPADSANKAWQPRAEAVTHDEQPLEQVITEARADYSSWKQYRKSRAKWIKKQKKKKKKAYRKFCRKFRKGKTEFNWNRLEEEEKAYEEEQKKKEEEKAERKRQKKEDRKARREERKNRREEKRNRKKSKEEETEEREDWWNIEEPPPAEEDDSEEKEEDDDGNGDDDNG